MPRDVAWASRSRQERAGKMPTPQRARRPRYKFRVMVCERSLAFNLYVVHHRLGHGLILFVLGGTIE